MQVMHTNDISKKNKYKEYVSQASTSVNMQTNERKVERERQNVY
jgi:hypothetical protein